MLRHLKQNCPNLVVPILKTKHHYHTTPTIQPILHGFNTPSSSLQNNEQQHSKIDVPPIMHTVPHPWPQWSALMLKLLKTGYFQENIYPFRTTQLGIKDIYQIRTACLNFARDRYQLIRYLSPEHIFHLAEPGCPDTDRKIVNSGKRLRAHFGIDEGNVCGSCILRENCQRAFLRVRKAEGESTVDVMRLLVAYGLDPLTGPLENMPCDNKMVKESAKILLKEMVEFSSETIDSQPVKTASLRSKFPSQDSAEGQTDVPREQNNWICPKCNFLNSASNIKCLRCDRISQHKLTKSREEEENLPQKKGDWICEKCTFLNFAKNSRCLKCNENPPERELTAGEWECESCNYINFRKNMACLKCDHNRPKAENHLSKSSYPASNNMGYPRTRSLFGVEKRSQEDSLQTQGRWRQEMDLSRKDANDRENADDSKCSMPKEEKEPFRWSGDEEMADGFQNRT